MDFGSSYVFAPTDSSQEYEEIPESRYNHVVTGYASGANNASSFSNDDGEVRVCGGGGGKGEGEVRVEIHSI